MARLNRKFQTTSPPLVTYDFSDIAEGTGYNEYFGASVSNAYALSKNAVYSNQVLTTTYNSSTAYQLFNDIDFDVQFNLPQDIKGTALIAIPIGFAGTATSRLYETYCNVKIRKWDGTTETDIANNTSQSVDNSADTTKVALNTSVLVSVDINEVTHFKRGETLRVTIEQYGRQVTNAANADWLIAHDPKNRTTSGHEELAQAGAGGALIWDGGDFDNGESIPSILSILMPFRLDT